MLQIFRSPDAIRDIAEIWDYIAAFNEEAADQIIDDITAIFELLASCPEAGRPREELAAGLRSFVVGKYLIFYRIRGGNLDIARVVHGARDLRRVFRKRPRGS